MDQQLPPVLARFLREQGHEAFHSRQLGLSESSDSSIWAHAARNDFVVISKDEDFLYLAHRPGDQGRLIWVRLGNCRTKTLTDRFALHLTELVAALEHGERVVEIW